MKNFKTVIIVVILILTGVLAVVGLRAAKTYLSGASGGASPQGVRAEADINSTTISWQTEKASRGVVEYGTTPASLLLRALETQETTAHRVTLSPLKANTTYYFRLKIGETIYDNNGIPYSFKTKSAEEGSSSVSPTAVPTVVQPTTAADGAKVTTCLESEFKLKFGSKDTKYDFDGNGVVNTKDWIECLKAQKD